MQSNHQKMRYLATYMTLTVEEYDAALIDLECEAKLEQLLPLWEQANKIHTQFCTTPDFWENVRMFEWDLPEVQKLRKSMMPFKELFRELFVDGTKENDPKKRARSRDSEPNNKDVDPK